MVRLGSLVLIPKCNTSRGSPTLVSSYLLPKGPSMSATAAPTASEAVDLLAGAIPGCFPRCFAFFGLFAALIMSLFSRALDDLAQFSFTSVPWTGRGMVISMLIPEASMEDRQRCVDVPRCANSRMMSSLS